MLLVVAHPVHHREPRDGIVLGIVVGAGFAAFESAGYALQAMLDQPRPPDHREHPARPRRSVRLLAPFGHITWTALLGGALLRELAGAGASA